jgi:hypothetical protein
MFPSSFRAAVDKYHSTHRADLIAFFLFSSSETNFLAPYPGSAWHIDTTTKFKLKQPTISPSVARRYFCVRRTYADNRRPGYYIIRKIESNRVNIQCNDVGRQAVCTPLFSNLTDDS